MSAQDFFGLKDQVAIVTGGGQGIGEGIARRLAAAGARVAVLDVKEDLARSVAESIGGVGVECDVASASSVEKAIDEVRRRLGPVDILVNNAGIAGRTLPLTELNEQDLDQVYAVNLKGVFLTCKAVMPDQGSGQRSGGQRRRHRQQHFARRGSHQDSGLDFQIDAGLHAQQDSHGAHRKDRRNCRPGAFSRFARVVFHHRTVL